MIRRNLKQTNSRKRVPFKLTIKKKIDTSKDSRDSSTTRDLSLLAVLQKQAFNNLQNKQKLKLTREQQKVDPNTFYHQLDSASVGRKPTYDIKNKAKLKIKKTDHQQSNEKYYNSTVLLKTPHTNSNDIGLDHHNLSARTLETKNSLNALRRKYSKCSKKLIKRRLNQTVSNEDRKGNKQSTDSSERTQPIPLFIKRTINNPPANAYNTNHPDSTKRKVLFNIDTQNTPSNRMNTSRYIPSEKVSLVCVPSNFVESFDRKESNHKLSKDSINISHSKDLAAYNSTRRSKSDRREANIVPKSKITNLPVLNKSIPEKLEFSDQMTSRNMRKTLRQNLVEKLKTFGISNNTANQNTILQAINENKEKESEEHKLSLNETQKSNFNTNNQPSSFDNNTRESSNLENTKITSRKNMIVVQDSRKFSKEVHIDSARRSKNLSLSESVTKVSNQGSITNRFFSTKRDSNLGLAQNQSEERKRNSDEKKETIIETQVISPEDSNPQQPKIPKKTWPMKPGYCIKTFANELTEYEKGEILQYRKIYYVGSKAKKIKGAPWHDYNFGYDDDKGDYLVVIGDHMAYRYEIVESLGKGSFGHVLKCWDHKNKEYIGLKIIRNQQKLIYQANVEIKILTHLRDNDIDDNYNIVRIMNSLEFRSHICVIFELLSINLYDFLKLNDFEGVSMGLIRRFAIQILYALNYLKSENIVHCDLKPENIVLKNKYKSGLKIIDFGSSTFINERVYTYIQSRFYRAPEIMFGIPYGYPIDMWSFGCVLAELYSGYPLFPGENEKEQIGYILEICGVPEVDLLEQGARSHLFF